MDHLQLADAAPVPAQFQQLTARQPLQAGRIAHPLAQQALCRRRGKAKAADPVVIESAGFGRRQGPQQRAPETGLPRAEFVAIGRTHPGSADHAPEPGSRGEQHGWGPAPRGLQRSSDATQATTPDQHGHRVDRAHHGSCNGICVGSGR